MLNATNLKLCFIIVAIWVSNSALAQKSSSMSVRSQVVLGWLKSDTLLLRYNQIKKPKFQIDTVVEYSKAPMFWLVKEYMAGAKGKNLKDINFENVDIHKEYLTLYNLSFSSEKLYKENIKCFEMQSFLRGNIYLSFRLVNDVAVEVSSSKIQKGFHEGVDLLFFFDKENQIKEVFRHEWVE